MAENKLPALCEYLALGRIACGSPTHWGLVIDDLEGVPAETAWYCPRHLAAVSDEIYYQATKRERRDA